MTGLVELVTSLIILMILAIPLVVIYKHRATIKRWVKDPNYGSLSVWDTDGVKRAERSVQKARWHLEDAEDYLEWKKKKQAASEQEES